MKNERVELLDSFRFLAIMAVMLVHYTCRWTPPRFHVSLYPYGNFYGETFVYGGLGVEFFFIISGFVITYTLHNTSGLGAFFKNRWIRLFPPMLLCTFITFFVATGLDSHHYFETAHVTRNFLPSLTFVTPFFWSELLHRHFDWTALSYWSLWPEVQFYFVAAVVYFLNKRMFLRNFCLVAVALSLFNDIPDQFYHNLSSYHIPRPLQSVILFVYYNEGIVDLKGFIAWFTMGVIFQHLYKRQKIRLFSVPGIVGLYLFFHEIYPDRMYTSVVIIDLLMVSLFFVMIYRKNFLFFLNNRLFQRIGVISYTVYLIHEFVGVTLINRFGGYLGRLSFVSPFIVMVLCILFAEFSYRYYEKYAAKFLKRILFKSARGSKDKAVPAVSPAP